MLESLFSGFKQKSLESITGQTVTTDTTYDLTVDSNSDNSNTNDKSKKVEFKSELIEKLINNNKVLKENWEIVIRNATNSTYENFCSSINVFRKMMYKHMSIQVEFLFGYLRQNEYTADFVYSRQKDYIPLYEELKNLIHHYVKEGLNEETFDPDSLLNELEEFGKKFNKKTELLEKQVYPLYKKQ